MEKNDGNLRRISLNIRVDPDKFTLLESLRHTGFGLAKTERNRSDVYNEILGYGLQTQMLRNDIGDRDFEKLWHIINKIDWKKVSIAKIEKFLG